MISLAVLSDSYIIIDGTILRVIYKKYFFFNLSLKPTAALVLIWAGMHERWQIIGTVVFLVSGNGLDYIIASAICPV